MIFEKLIFSKFLSRYNPLSKEKEWANNESGEEETNAASSINLRFKTIHRTAFHEIVTLEETKLCTPVLLKRRFSNNGYSLPYGHS